MIQSAELIRLQDAGGGWGYRGGTCWTEPSCYALVALGAAGLAGSEAARRGASWLATRQRADGGWAPRDGVDQSTWVTALALLIPDGLLDAPRLERATTWLAAQTGRESSWTQRLRMRLLGLSVEDSAYDGWPWYPGAAAWVAPTALSILALEKIARRGDAARWRARIEQGRHYLLARRCRDGGWNHGSTRALGYDSDSYPETTGLALLALHDSKAPEMTRAEDLAMRQLASCASIEGACWLRLGLMARGKRPGDLPSSPPQRSHHSTIELALEAAVQAAAEGRHIFLE